MYNITLYIKSFIQYCIKHHNNYDNYYDNDYDNIIIILNIHIKIYNLY